MTTTDAERLRQLLGEEIPDGGTEADTLFTNTQIDELVARYDNLGAAVVEGWEHKAAKLASLVNTSEGDSHRSLSDLHKAALAQLEYYQRSGSPARTRLHSISRGGFEG